METRHLSGSEANIAALANPFLENAQPSETVATPSPQDSLVRLASLHVEASETARLANLLGRSLHVSIALPVLAAATVVLAANALENSLAWAALVGIATVAILRIYMRTLHQPFERAVLKAFAGDLDACLLYAGTAWGAGALLVLPPFASGATALAFAIVPSLAVAAILRETRPTTFFLAPVAALSSLACVMRPFDDAALAALLVLLACGVFAGALQWHERASEKQGVGGLPAGVLDTH